MVPLGLANDLLLAYFAVSDHLLGFRRNPETQTKVKLGDKRHLFSPTGGAMDTKSPAYCDYANHYGFAALTARVRTPRDKAPADRIIY